MTRLISKFEFEKRAKRLTASASTVVGEALNGKEFRGAVCFLWHKNLIARELLARFAPQLYGTLPYLMEEGRVEEAIQQATDALLALREAEPLLFVSSRITKPRVNVWLRKAWPHRGADELAGMVDRAWEEEAWAYQYDAMLRLQAEGINITELKDRIEKANPTHVEIVRQVAVASSVGGIIDGHDNATPQLVGDQLVQV